MQRSLAPEPLDLSVIEDQADIESTENPPDPDWELRYAKVRQYISGEVPLVERLEGLRLALNDSHPSVRYCAVTILKGMDELEVTDHLIYALSDSYEWVRIRAIEGLGERHAISASELFVQYLDKEDNPKVKATFVKHLGRFQEEKFIPIIANYLNDPDARVRANSVEGLGFYPSEMVQHIIRPFLDDDNARIRANVAVVLSKSKDTTAAETIESMLNSPNTYERMGAIYTIGELQDEKYISTLFGFLNDPSYLVQRNVRDALIKFGLQIQGPLLKEIRSKKSMHFILGAIQVIASIGDKKSLKTLLKLQEIGDGEVRATAEEAIDKICARVDGVIA